MFRFIANALVLATLVSTSIVGVVPIEGCKVDLCNNVSKQCCGQCVAVATQTCCSRMERRLVCDCSVNSDPPAAPHQTTSVRSVDRLSEVKIAVVRIVKDDLLDEWAVEPTFSSSLSCARQRAFLGCWLT